MESQLPPTSTHFQTISLLKADEWANLPPSDHRRQTPFTACRQRLKRKDWRNTQLLCLNQPGLYPQILPLTPSPVSSLPSPMDKPPPSQQSSHQLTRGCQHPSRETLHIFINGSVQGGSEDGDAGLVVLSQDDLVHKWHAPQPRSRQRRQPSKKPSNGHPPFNYGPQLSSSVTANHWVRPSATLTQLTRLSSNCRLQRQYSLC